MRFFIHSAEDRGGANAEELGVALAALNDLEGEFPGGDENEGGGMA